MANIGELSIGIQVDRASVSDATKKIKKDMEATGLAIEKNIGDTSVSSAQSASGAFSNLGSVIGSMFAVGVIAEFGRKLLGLGSDLNETSSKFDVIFGASNNARESFYALADQVGRSRLDMITFGSSVGNVLSPLGFAQDEVAKLSLNLTELAVDVASFNNVSDEQAVNAFTSALTGEREALKSLGIVINDADVKNEALKLGFGSTGEALSKSQIALSTYSLLLQNTANAQGDATRTGDSFANQLKRLQGNITDLFAFTGVQASESASGVLSNINSFVSSYGQQIISTIGNFLGLLGSAISTIWTSLTTTFGLFTSETEKSKDGIGTVTQAFSYLGAGARIVLEAIVATIQSVILIVGLLGAGLVKTADAFSKSFFFATDAIGKGIRGTLVSAVTIVRDGSLLIGEIFAGLARALTGVFTGIAQNATVGIKKAVNGVISGINVLIEGVNKIPGVNVNKIMGLADVSFVPIELGWSKTSAYVTEQAKKLGSNVKSNYADMGDAISQTGDVFAQTFDGFGTKAGDILGTISNAWGNVGDKIVNINADIASNQAKIDGTTKKSAEDLAKIREEEAKKKKKEFDDMVSKYKDAGTASAKSQAQTSEGTKKLAEDAKNAQKMVEDQAKTTADGIKTSYDSWKNKTKEVSEASKKLAEDTGKYNQNIQESIRSLTADLQKQTSEYKKATSEIQAQGAKDLASRGTEVDKNLLQNQKDLADARSQEVQDLDRIVQLEAERARLLAEQQFVAQNTTEAQRAEAQRVAGLSESQKIAEATAQKIAEKTAEYEAEKQKTQKILEINKEFLSMSALNQQQYTALVSSARFEAMTKEEQDLVLKLAREKLALTTQKDAIVLQQQEIAAATKNLSDATTLAQVANIGKVKAEYQSLIADIQSAINKQNELNSIGGSAKRGFSVGGYTGGNKTSDVVGVVHGGEYVIPAWMVQQNGRLVQALENNRLRGFSEGGHTSNVSKTQNNNITVNSALDLGAFLAHAKWKL